MKKTFYMTDLWDCDIKIRARSIDEVRELFQHKKWHVYDLDDPDCPDLDNAQYVSETDIDDKSKLLKAWMKIDAKTGEGKHLIPVEGRLRDGTVARRQVWARSEQELLSKHRSLRFLYGLPITMAEWEAMGESDIDVDDDFVGNVL